MPRKKQPTENTTTGEAVELTVDLAGLIRIFGEALYKDFGSVVRELTQNAHDAIIMELAQDQNKNIALYNVDITYDANTSRLVIADNGIGMTKAEINNNLNNFAKSNKSIIQSAVSSSSDRLRAENLTNVIGEYGVGFLSAMAVSESVSVYSRHPPSNPVMWIYRAGNATASLSEIDNKTFEAACKSSKVRTSSSGTIIDCKLSQRALEEYYIDEDDVRSSIATYAGLLPIKIYFNGELLSTKYVAWNDPTTASNDDWTEVIRDMHKEEPVLVIPIYSGPKELDLTGVIWIPERTRYFSNAEMDIYIKRMFVVSDTNVVVPSWSRFLKGMINSNKLRRIVSGNAIKSDKMASRTREFIKQCIISELKKLRTRQVIDYNRIVGPHDEAIKGSAVDDDEFLDCVWDRLRVPAGNKRITITEYLAAVERKTGRGDTVYFYDEKKNMHSADLVSDATGIPVFDLSQTRDGVFIRKIASKKDLKLSSYKELADEHFQKEEDEAGYDGLVAACAEFNVDAEVRRYEPAYLPAVLIDDKNLKDKRENLIRGLREHGEEHFARDIERLFEKRLAANYGVSFYLNSANPLIQSLCDAEFEEQCSVCLALYNISFMAAVPDLVDYERQKIYESIARVIQTSLLAPELEDALKTAEGQISGRANNIVKLQRPITMFMITPFSEEYRILEEAVRSIFEDAPYYFKVLLARDYTFEPTLLANVKKHLANADLYIAEISDLNANVMLELGAVMLSDERKPIFALRGSDAKKDVPSDIKSELYIPYDSTNDSRESIIKDIKAAIERDGRTSHESIKKLMEGQSRRAITKILLTGMSVRQSEREMDSILRHYDTIESFMDDKPDDIVKKTGIKNYLIMAMRAEFLERSGKTDYKK